MDKEKCLIVTQTTPETDPIYKKWQKKGYHTGVIFRDLWKPLRIVRRLIARSSFPFGKFIYNKWIDELDDYTTIIIHASVLTRHLPKYIHRKYPSMRIIMWYWNHINSKMVPDKKNEEWVEYWSFDRGDCAKYNIKYNIQYYEPSIELGTKYDIESDIFFIGHDHGRLNKILQVKKIAEEQGLTCDIRISKTSGGWSIPYTDIEETIQKTRAILEIMQTGQEGLTLRAMESLFYEKKLITDNKTIKKEPFYCKNNIFVLGEDSDADLLEFVRSPYDVRVSKYKKQYDLDAWFLNFDRLNTL